MVKFYLKLHAYSKLVLKSFLLLNPIDLTCVFIKYILPRIKRVSILGLQQLEVQKLIYNPELMF